MVVKFLWMFVACASLLKQLFVSDSVIAMRLVVFFHVAEVGALSILFHFSFEIRYLSVTYMCIFEASQAIDYKVPGFLCVL